MDDPWVWDASRNKYYYYDSNTQCYVYGDGERVSVATQQGGQTQATSYAEPPSAPHARHVSQGSSDWSVVSRLSNMSISDSAAPAHGGGVSNDQGQTNSSTVQAAAPSQYYGHNYGPSASQSGVQCDANQETQYGGSSGYDTPVPGQYQSQAGAENQQSTVAQDKEVSREVDIDPGEDALPEDLKNKGRRPRMMIRGSGGNAETLDPGFKVRFPGYEFFKVGVVFRMLWPELAGDSGNRITIATVPVNTQGERVFCKGESVYCKVRWFVVVREGHNCCTCLSIQTYQGHGVTGTKVKSHHAIMYTGPTPPRQLPSENPSHRNERPMGDPIRVISYNPDKPWDTKMDERSRVNFVKLYTVEHNVKVEQFGYVDPNDEWSFTSQFNLHWGRSGSNALPPADRRAAFTASQPNPPLQGNTPSYGTQMPAYHPAHDSRYGMPPVLEDTASGYQGPHRQQPPPTHYPGYPPNQVPYYQQPAPNFHSGGSIPRQPSYPPRGGPPSY